MVGSNVTTRYLQGRGPKVKIWPKDVFFMMLNVLHAPTKRDKHNIDFGMKGPAIEKQVWKMMALMVPILCQHFVEQAPMKYLQDRNTLFPNFPYPHHAIDVQFVHSSCPSGAFEEVRPYFSGKHHLYGLKVEVSVLLTGQAINWMTNV